MKVLVHVFKWILTLEYIPENFREGVQVPLHMKGKNTSILETNNLRGITLLNTFNKIFEMLIWNRLKDWWAQNEVVSKLQGACRTGISCVHTTMLMQETIAEKLETHRKVFVLYLDVSKALTEYGSMVSFIDSIAWGLGVGPGGCFINVM